MSTITIPQRARAAKLDSGQVAADVIAVLTGSLLIALSAQVRIFVGDNPVPITPQTLVVVSLPFFLSGWRAPAAVAAYLAQGLFGLPFFAGGNAGTAYFASFTGGYLLGFLAAAVVVSVLRDRLLTPVAGQADHRRTWQVAAMTIGNLVIYVLGVAWLAIKLGSLGDAIVTGMLPFLIGDAVKIAIASALVPRRTFPPVIR